LVLAIGASPAAAQQGSRLPSSPDARRLTVDDAVQQALEHNLGIQVARVNPQVQDITIAQLLSAWNPGLTSSLANSRTNSPNSSFLSGTLGNSTIDQQLSSNVSLRQALKWNGASYSVGWDNSRTTTTNLFANYSPQVNSALSLSYVQPLLRNFSIDSSRQQLAVGRKNRDIADLELQSSIVNTTRSVRNTYWELVYAIETLKVQQQSLDLARESLRNNQKRVEIGTMAPIDVVEAEAEVAQRDEAVIVAEADIARSEDALRVLIDDPSTPDFWSYHIEPTDPPPFEPAAVDVDGAVRHALDRRTDLREAQKTLEADDVSIKYYRNQVLPDVTAELDYGLAGIGGTQALRGAGFPGPIIGTTETSYGSVLADVFGNSFPKWTLKVNMSYPLGHSQQETTLARARVQHSQSQLQLRNQQLQVATQVRDAARSLQTNQKRVASTRAARELADRRLQAEQKKFTAGQSTSFFVFQAQRDLAQAQNSELRAILDYNRSVVDFDAIQEVPLNGPPTSATAPPTTTASTTTTVSAGSSTSTSASPTQ
jgi:outer membrane protein TolC